MERKSIGSFINALRKAAGMTQQDLADRLNVSPKAVSRWERDENAPDITLIPAIAEIFNITCDELLRGERIFGVQNGGEHERRDPRVDRRQRALIGRAVSSFKTLVWISLALSAVGLVCMFGISWGFYLPVLGFALMLVCVIPAVIITAVAVGKLRDTRRDNELFETAPASLLDEYDRVLGNYSYCAYSAAVSAVTLSLPPMFYLSNYTYSVLSFNSYLRFFVILAPLLALLFCIFKDIYCTRITGRHVPKRKKDPRVTVMNTVQLISLAVATSVYLFFPLTSWDFRIAIIDIVYTCALIMLAINIFAFVFCFVKFKNDREAFMIPGVRNLLLTIPTALLGSNTGTQINAALIIGLAIIVFVIFKLIGDATAKRH